MTTLQEAAMRQALEAYCAAWEKSFKEANPYHTVSVGTEDRRHIDAGLRAALAQQGEPDQRLVNLLCRIHRDGGHYIGEHGIDKAVSDADMKVANLNALSDAAAPAPQAPFNGTDAAMWLTKNKLAQHDLLSAPQPNIQNQIVKDISRHEPCQTCAHYQQGKRTGVSIHDETCYGCSEYYANKWEMK